jgi:signal peptidase II
VLVLLADQVLKIWVKTYFTENQIRSIPLIGDWAVLHYVENNGIAFGLELPGEWGKFMLTLFRIIAAGFIFYYFLWRSAKKYVPMGLVYSWGLVFAGATGNIIDSIFYGVWFRDINDYVGGLFHGKVVDQGGRYVLLPDLQGLLPGLGSVRGRRLRRVFQACI